MPNLPKNRPSFNLPDLLAQAQNPYQPKQLRRPRKARSAVGKASFFPVKEVAFVIRWPDLV